MSSYPSQKFSIGDAISATLSTYGTALFRWSVLVLLFLIVAIAIFVGIGLTAFSDFLTNGQQVFDPQVIAARGIQSFAGSIFISFVVVFAIYVFLEAMMVIGTVSHLSTGKVSIAKLWGPAFSRTHVAVTTFFVLALIFIVSGVVVAAIVAGLSMVAGGDEILSTIVAFVFIVPLYLFLIVEFFVAIPVAVLERRGVFGSIGRGARLVRGNRWRILALVLIYFAVALVASLIIEGLALIPPLAIVSNILNFLAQIATTALALIGTGVIYHQLRLEKEGPETTTVAAVFD